MIESATGDVAHVDETFFSPESTLPDGTRALFLSTLSGSADGGNFSGNDAVSTNALESFLNLQSRSILNDHSVGDGSAITLSIVLEAGESIRFQYNFLTAAIAGDGNDFAFYTLQFESAAPLIFDLAQINNATFSSTSSLFDRETGFQSFTLPTVTFSGNYTLGFGVIDSTDDAIQSGLLVDAVEIIPEPSVMVLIFSMLGIAGCGRLRRT